EAAIAVASAHVGVDAAEPRLDDPKFRPVGAEQPRQREEGTRLVERPRVIAIEAVARGAKVVPGIEMLARQAELADEIPDADESNLHVPFGHVTGNAVGKRDRNGGAAAEPDDVDDGVAGVEVVAQPPDRLPDALVA